MTVTPTPGQRELIECEIINLRAEIDLLSMRSDDDRRKLRRTDLRLTAAAERHDALARVLSGGLTGDAMITALAEFEAVGEMSK